MSSTLLSQSSSCSSDRISLGTNSFAEGFHAAKAQSPSSKPLFEGGQKRSAPEEPYKAHLQKRRLEGDCRWRQSLPHGRLVEKITAQGSPRVNIARSCFMLATSRLAEDFIRSYHPALSGEDMVVLNYLPGEDAVWGVEQSTQTTFPLNIGGLKVHFCPSPTIRSGFPHIALNDPLNYLSIKSVWSDDRVLTIRSLFPNSIGCRILSSGYVVILYENNKKIIKDRHQTGIPDTVGLLPVSVTVDTVIPTQCIPYGSQLSSDPHNLIENKGTCGVKLRHVDGTSSITTTTHAFVERPYLPSAPKFAREMLHHVLVTPFRRALSCMGMVPAVLTTRKPSKRSPLGTVVYVGETGQRIGTITTTFDRDLDTSLPYPVGYKHNLSLITDVDLPNMCAPPGFPRIIGWADLSDATDGREMFAVRNNIWVPGAWRGMKGQKIAEDAQRAHVEGLSFYWKREAFDVTRALLWRTEQPADTAGGYSGTALCLGRLTDPTATLLLFQNFEIPNKIPTAPHPHFKQSKSSGTMKGGFILPQEIRACEILMESGPEVLPQMAGTAPTGDRTCAFDTNKGSEISRGGSAPLS